MGKGETRCEKERLNWKNGSIYFKKILMAKIEVGQVLQDVRGVDEWLI